MSLSDKSRWYVDRTGPEEITITVDELKPTTEEIKLMATKPLPLGLRGIDNCGAGSNEYRFNDPLALWKDFPITYACDDNSVTSQSFRDGIDKSFAVFNELKSDFFRKTGFSSAEIKIYMNRIDASNGILARANWSYSLPSNIITKASITFDTSENWAWLDRESCGSYGSIYDIGNTAVHEICHTLCLAHAPTDRLQTMYATTAPGKTLGRTLGNGDKLGIMKAYNLTESPPTPPPTPPPPPEPEPEITEAKITTIDGTTYLNLAYENIKGKYIPITTLTGTHSLPFNGVHAKIITISNQRYVYLYYYRQGNIFTTLGRIPLQ